MNSVLFRTAISAFLAAATASALGVPAPSASASAAPEITYAEDGATAVSIRAPLPPPSTSLAKLSGEQRDDALCYRFLGGLTPLFNLGDARAAFRVESRERAGEDVHFKLRQRIGAIPVYGSESGVHFARGSGLFLGRIRRVTPGGLPTQPLLKAQDALDRALADLASAKVRIAPLAAEQQELLGDAGPESELVFFPGDADVAGEGAAAAGVPGAAFHGAATAASWHLAWRVRFHANIRDAWEYLVDARGGQVLLRFPVTCTVGPATATAKDLKGVTRDFGTYLHSNSKYYLIDAARPMFNATKSVFPDKAVGAIVTMDMQNTPLDAPSYKHITTTDNKWTNTKGVSAHFNAGAAYQYYLDTHKRNSIDGKGGTIRSFVNVADYDGSGLDNAFWNGNSMFYGNGGTLMKPLAAALDVSGHELTHGVVQATCNLSSTGQGGALNESLADIFGSMIEGLNWKMGEDIVKTAFFPSGAIRDLSNPHNGASKGDHGWQPASMSEFQKLPTTEEGDMGGVHVNDGIPNRAFYLFATAIGKEKAAQVYYRAMTTYLTASSKFADMRVAAVESAKDLFTDVEVKAAENAFDQVGLPGTGPVAPKQNAFAVNPGAQYVLLTKTKPGTGSTLFVADSAFANPKPLTSTPVRTRPSVTDDGKLAVFVSQDGRIISVTVDAAAPKETVLDENKVWSMAAISKDGLHFAAVKIQADSSIYIGTVGVIAPLKKFPLYNPTFEGLRTGGVQYAGTIDWDYSGDVVYDAFNSIKGLDGSPISYWDVGFLHAWDDSTGVFADGKITKLFSNLPDGVSIGNAAFARNSPDVVVYEYLDENSGSFTIQAMDLDTRKTGTIVANEIISWPSYDKRDAAVAYTSVSGTDTVISLIALKSDKITPAGTAKKVATGYKWPVFLAKGTRFQPISVRRPGLAGRLLLDARYDRAAGKIVVAYGLQAATDVRMSIFDAEGRSLAVTQSRENGGAHRFEWAPNASAGSRRAGLFLIRLEAGSQVRVAKILAGF